MSMNSKRINFTPDKATELGIRELIKYFRKHKMPPLGASQALRFFIHKGIKTWFDETHQAIADKIEALDEDETEKRRLRNILNVKD